MIECKRCGGRMELVSAQDLAKGICALCSLRDRLQMGDIGMAMKADGTHIGGVMKDNGTRETLTPGGGAREAQSGKGRFDLLPAEAALLLPNEPSREVVNNLISALTANDKERILGIGRTLVRDYADIEALALWYEAGAVKYAPFNWTKSLPRWQIESSLTRHMFKLGMGLDDEDHRSAVLWNICAWLYFSERVVGWYDAERVQAEERWRQGG